MAGRRRPSAAEIEEDLARRQKRLRTEKAGMAVAEKDWAAVEWVLRGLRG